MPDEVKLHWGDARPGEVGLYLFRYSDDAVTRLASIYGPTAMHVDGRSLNYQSVRGQFACTPDNKPWRLPEVGE